MFKSEITFEELCYEVAGLIKEYGLEPLKGGDWERNSSRVYYAFPERPGITSGALITVAYGEILNARVPIYIALATSCSFGLNNGKFNININNSRSWDGVYNEKMDLKKWKENKTCLVSILDKVKDETQNVQKKLKQFSLKFDQMLADVNA